MDHAYSVAAYYTKYAIEDKIWSYAEKIQVLNPGDGQEGSLISPIELEEFINREFWRHFHVEMLVHGDLSIDVAKNLASQTLSILTCSCGCNRESIIKPDYKPILCKKIEMEKQWIKFVLPPSMIEGPRSAIVPKSTDIVF